MKKRFASLVMRGLMAGLLTLGVAGCTKSKDTAELKGKTLNLYLKDNVKSGDPATAYDSVSLEPLPQVYETLYQYDYFSKKKRIIPLLADGMPQYSPDRKTITIKIKKGIKFANDPAFPNGQGRELTAKDFLFGWKRHVVTNVVSEGTWIFDGKIVGYNEFLQKYKNVKNQEEVMNEDIEGMKALDDYTLQLKLTKPYPQLMYVLSMSFAAPVAVEAVKHYGKEFVNHPVGTGPYRVVSWEPQSKVILTKNENFNHEVFPSEIDPEYKAEAAPYIGKALPLTDNVVFRVIKQEQPRWLEILDGNIDQIEIPKDYTDAAIDPNNPKDVHPDLKKKGLKVSLEPGVVFWYLFFNMEDPFLKEHKLVRQAISSALNRETWVSIFRSKRGEIANELNPTSINDRCGNEAKLKFDYNPARAKELLAKAGFPGGKGIPVLNFDLRGTDTTYRQLGEFVQKSLGDIGIQINVIPNTFPAYLEKRTKKNLQISAGGWNLDYPDADNALQLFYGANTAPGPNDSNFVNARYDELYLKQVLMESGPARRKVVCEMDAILQEESPMVLGFYENLYRLVGSRVRNFHTYEMAQNKYKYIGVADAKAEGTQANNQ